jgi:transcriptional regulator with XRE-family HTH domain
MKTIKQLREEQSFSQQEVMKAIGMKSVSNYSKIENRKQKPRITTRRKIAEFFKVSPTDIDF